MGYHRLMSPRVLLVDDDREHLRHLAQTLYHAGFQVQTEQRGSAALEAMRGQPPDALVLELMLPEMSGFRLIEAARRMAPPECLAIVVTTDIFTTRHCREDAIQRFGLLGMLAKPTDPAQVVELLCQQAAAGQSQLAPRFEEDSRALGAAPPRPLSSSEGPEPEEVTQPNIIQPRFEAEEVPLLEPSPPTAAAAAAAAQPREAMRVLTPLAPAFAERLQPRPLASVRLEGIVPRPPTSGEEEELPETLLRGDFLQTPFPALLFGLSEQRATGALYLRQERKKKV
ncbi:MAG: response regulator, partial [Deltaproteobacteria bacterium]|nr:response regulator [Deltaproteobacteria bacterium]